jgi:hypothetical protein
MTRDQLIYGAVVAVRLILPLLIARYPLPAILGCLVVDALDQTIFQAFTHRDLGGYQVYDKALDVYYLTLAYVSTIRNWGGGPDFTVGRWLWYYRLVGVAIFEYTSAGWILLVFPNTFEYYFIAIEWYKVHRDPNRLSARRTWMIAAVIWVVIKLPQEWWIHIADLDFTDFVLRHVFGAPTGTSWASAVSERPLAAVGLVAAGVALSAGAITLFRRLPPEKWATTLDANRQDALMGWRVPRREARPGVFLGWAFAEKVVLVAMVLVIFARILPGANTHVARVLAATTYLLAVNTVLSQFLAHRRASWRNTAAQFAWMACANFVVLLTTAATLGRRGDAPLQTTVFLVALLTLIVVVYDRSHGVFADQQDQRDLVEKASAAGLEGLSR